MNEGWKQELIVLKRLMRHYFPKFTESWTRYCYYYWISLLALLSLCCRIMEEIIHPFHYSDGLYHEATQVLSRASVGAELHIMLFRSS